MWSCLLGAGGQAEERFAEQSRKSGFLSWLSPLMGKPLNLCASVPPLWVLQTPDRSQEQAPALAGWEEPEHTLVGGKGLSAAYSHPKPQLRISRYFITLMLAVQSESSRCICALLSGYKLQKDGKEEAPLGPPRISLCTFLQQEIQCAYLPFLLCLSSSVVDGCQISALI